jgi:hypothetical protein
MPVATYEVKMISKRQSSSIQYQPQKQVPDAENNIEMSDITCHIMFKRCRSPSVRPE